MKNRDCNLVKDLLPNYVENLTNEDTNLFIENHLKECKECSNILNSMKFGEDKSDENETKKFVNYSKKFRNKYKLLKYIILIILFVLIFHTVRNCIIYSIIIKRHNNSISQKTNYHYQMYDYSKDSLLSEEWYVKDGKFLYSHSYCNFNENSYQNRKFYLYFDGEQFYSYDVDNKVVTVSKVTENSLLRPYIMEPYNIIKFEPLTLLECILCKIDSCNVNGQDCYRMIDLLDNSSEFMITYDKATGMPVKSSNLASGTEVSIFHYLDFDVVTDDDLKVPNSEEYIYKTWQDLLIEDLEEHIKNNNEDFIKMDLKAMINENIEIPSEYYEKYKYLLE